MDDENEISDKVGKTPDRKYRGEITPYIPKRQITDSDIITYKEIDGIKFTYLNGQNICGAKTRQRQGICLKSPIRGRNRCMLHGGKSLHGLANPQFKTGKGSKDLPSRLAVKYEESMRDPKLMELRSDIALMDTRLKELLGKLDDQDSRDRWAALKQEYKNAKDATRAGDKAEFAQSFNEIGRIINLGLSDYQKWDEISKTVGRKKSLIESERKSLIEKQQMISSEEAMVLIGFIISVIKNNVTDRDQMIAITSEISKYLASKRDIIKIGGRE